MVCVYAMSRCFLDFSGVALRVRLSAIRDPSVVGWWCKREGEIEDITAIQAIEDKFVENLECQAKSGCGVQ